MNAEIISIGNELLKGFTVNTNAAFISTKLEEIGIPVQWVTTVGDDEGNILQAIELAEKRADLIISTGGLGPTHDDITKKAFAKYFESEFVLNEQILEKLHQRFRRRNMVMSKCNEQQALVPEKAKILENNVGTAPGLLFEKSGKLFFVLPGVPTEMEWIVNNEILPRLKKMQHQYIANRVIHTYGIPESTLFYRLGDIEELEKYCQIAFLPHMGLVDVRLSAMDKNLQQCRENIDKVESVIKEKAGEFIIGFDEESVESMIIKELQKRQLSLAVIEMGTQGEFLNALLKAEDSYRTKIYGIVVSDFNSRDSQKTADGNTERKIASGLIQLSSQLPNFEKNALFEIIFDPNRGALSCRFNCNEIERENREVFPISGKGQITRAAIAALVFLYKSLQFCSRE